MTAPDTFPRSGAASDLAYTNGKIIVARSYVSLLPRSRSDLPATTVTERRWHGGGRVRNAGPLTIAAWRQSLARQPKSGSPG